MVSDERLNLQKQQYDTGYTITAPDGGGDY